ncbi:MAG: winged helix-turn-helix transcriptional regulator [Bacillota bacterium]
MGGIRKEREDYIPLSGPVNRNQKIVAKEAILVLLKNGSHTTREIAEHFGLSVETVNTLIDELARSGRVNRPRGRRNNISLKNTCKRV